MTYKYQRVVNTNDRKGHRILEPATFFRINRGYLINITSIKEMETWSRGRIKLALEPRLKDERDAIVSIGRSSEFKKWLGQ